MTEESKFDESLLDSVTFIGFLPPDVRALVHASFETARFPFGSVIVREGEPADTLYVLTEGRARVIKPEPDGREIVLNKLGPGDSFGELGLLRGGRRTATVRASSEVEAIRLDGVLFRGLVGTNTDVRRAAELAVRVALCNELIRMDAGLPDLPRDVAVAIAERSVELTCSPGDVVLDADRNATSLFIVQGGRLRARVADGPPQAVAYYRRGDLIGRYDSISMLSSTPTVDALTDAVLLEIAPELYDELVDRFPPFDEFARRRIGDRMAAGPARVPLDFVNIVPPEPISAAEPSTTASRRKDPTHAGGTAGAGTAARPGGRRFRFTRQIDEADCAAACLAMVCRHHGLKFPLSQIRRTLSVGLEGASLAAIVAAAERLGLTARATKVSRRNLEAVDLPAILHWRGNHWVVLRRLTTGGAQIADPATGVRSVSRAELERHWTGYTVQFHRHAGPAPPVERTTGMRWIWPFLGRHKPAIAAAGLLALLVSAAQLTVPLFMQVAIDDLIPDADVNALRTMALILLGVAALIVVGAAAQRLVLSIVAVRVDEATLDFLSARLLALPMGYFYKRRSGDIQRRLAGVRLVREFAVHSAVLGLTAATQLLACVALMVIIDAPLASLYAAILPVVAGLMWWAARKLRPVLASLEDGFGEYYSRQIDAVKGIETVKALAAEDQLRVLLQRDFRALSRRLFKADFWGMAYDAAVTALNFTVLAAFFWLGSNRVIDGDMTVGELVSFNTLVLLTGGALVVLLALWDDWQYGAVLINRVSDVFDEAPEQADRQELVPVRSLEGRVTLQRLRFGYDESAGSPILDDISLDIPPGTTVAIVGRSGSGKTTLAKCLVGLVEPTSGRILLDGVELDRLDYASLRRRFGLVLQDTFLFSGTVAENIAFGHDEVDLDRVVRAAQTADAHDFVQALPLSYETRIGETGLLLSGGQRQRIAIARALYGDPAVLILDEATSTLDTGSERTVQANLQRVLAGRTAIIIAHRLSTVRDADVIVVLDRGRIVEQGTHDELLARQGLYAYLCGQQLAV